MPDPSADAGLSYPSRFGNGSASAAVGMAGGVPVHGLRGRENHQRQNGGGAVRGPGMVQSACRLLSA